MTRFPAYVGAAVALLMILSVSCSEQEMQETPEAGQNMIALQIGKPFLATKATERGEEDLNENKIFRADFFFYPDGCGAIMAFQDNAHYREPARIYSVYGDYLKQKDLLDLFDQDSPAVMMPVFGMNRGGHGLLAIIEEGAETSRISLNSSNNIIGISYLFPNFQYRRAFDDKRVTSRDIMVFDRDDIKTDYQVRYLFMEEDDATYSAMACTYRNYLLQTGRVQRTERQPSVALDLFMTAPEEGLLFDTPRTVTTLSHPSPLIPQPSPITPLP